MLWCELPHHSPLTDRAFILPKILLTFPPSLLLIYTTPQVGGDIVDLALGTDQGGSIRVPASWCGCVGLKPTFGLVPYTGIASHEFTLDHVGPMARTVQDTALLLEATAGLDPMGRDARQPPTLASLSLPRYSVLATGEVSGVRVGVLREGLENCEEDVKEATWAAAKGLIKAGAVVEEISIPMHRDSAALWLPLCLEGGHATRMEGERGFKGFYPVSLTQAYFRGFRLQAAELSCTNKYYVLFGEYVRETYGNQYYQKCQNLLPALRQAYDDVLVQQRVDVLLLPTLPIKPQRLPKAGMTPAEVRLLHPSLPPSLPPSLSHPMPAHQAQAHATGWKDPTRVKSVLSPLFLSLSP